MNPQLQYFSDSECEINKNFDSILQDSCNEEEQLPFSLQERILSNQFEQQSILNVQQDSTQCSSEPQDPKKNDLEDESEDLHCYEEEESKLVIGEPQPLIKCQCSKSKCQQSYCECFARGKLCNESCGCQNCKNDQMTKGLTRIIKRLKKQKRNKQRTPRFLQGCTCGKSKCINKFCSCHQDGKYCSKSCKCVNCKNIYKFCLRSLELEEQIGTSQQNNQILFFMGLENSNKFNEYKDKLFCMA